MKYRRVEKTGWDPAACDKCKQCEDKCPNKIPVVSLMEAAVQVWPRA